MKNAVLNAFELSRGKVAQQIEQLGSRLTLLRRRADGSSENVEALIADTLQELSSAVEELLVAEEELNEQNEKLEAIHSALVAQQQRYQDLFESAPDSYLVTNVDGTILEANRAALELLHINRDFLPGIPLIAFVVETDRAAFRQDLQRLETTERIAGWLLKIQPRIRLPLVDVAATVSAVRDHNGKLISLRWLLRDVTDRLRAEEETWALNAQLEQRVAERTAQLEEASRAKDEFLAELGHELRNPLTAMANAAGILRLVKVDSQDADQSREILDRQIQKMTCLLDDLLDLSRIVDGKVRLNRRVESLADISEPA